MKNKFLIGLIILAFIVISAGSTISISQIKGDRTGDPTLWQELKTRYTKTEVDNLLSDTIRITDIPEIPTIYSFSGDTANMPVPVKAGNIFIDTSGNNVYISKSAIRGGWLKLN